jgi:hypothetical protein
VADDSNGRREKLFVLEPMVGMLEAKDVLRASKPVAYLWEWAAALVHAARAIVNRESLALKMEAQHGVHAAAAAAFDEAAAVLKARQGEQKQAEAAYQAAFEGEFELPRRVRMETPDLSGHARTLILTLPGTDHYLTTADNRSWRPSCEAYTLRDVSQDVKYLHSG